MLIYLACFAPLAVAASAKEQEAAAAFLSAADKSGQQAAKIRVRTAIILLGMARY